jgi:hypothetical protein
VDVPPCGGLLVVPLGTAPVRGTLAPRLGPPAGRGARVAGGVVGCAVRRWVEPQADVRLRYAPPALCPWLRDASPPAATRRRRRL